MEVAAVKGSFSRVFDLQPEDMEESASARTSPYEGRFPVNIGITGFVAATGQVFKKYLQFCGIGLKNARLYERSQLENKRNQVCFVVDLFSYRLLAYIVGLWSFTAGEQEKPVDLWIFTAGEQEKPGLFRGRDLFSYRLLAYVVGLWIFTAGEQEKPASSSISSHCSSGNLESPSALPWSPVFLHSIVKLYEDKINAHRCSRADMFDDISRLGFTCTDSKQVLLDLARAVFEEQSTLETVVLRIMAHTQALLECQRCQVLLIDESSQGSFSRVFDLQPEDMEESASARTSPYEGRFPVNIGITGFVAATGQVGIGFDLKKIE
ncbi:PDE5A [Cordylochernes scorpioides]|uniref:PDE5A n=1 Tax=Cordylochernes scorpioides TaxID=51811 RepID=A0ABY6KNX2_9ARAC|nr:PDE5A [Cordylochernes scorpioides]